jgi:hypothetical protein
MELGGEEPCSRPVLSLPKVPSSLFPLSAVEPKAGFEPAT